MNPKIFMNQKVEDMTVSELASAIKLKIKQQTVEDPVKREVKVGDTVRIIRDYTNGIDPYNRVGKIGKVVELDGRSEYRYNVDLANEMNNWVTKVELVKEEKQTLSPEEKINLKKVCLSDKIFCSNCGVIGHCDCSQKQPVLNMDHAKSSLNKFIEVINPIDHMMMTSKDYYIFINQKAIEFFGKRLV